MGSSSSRRSSFLFNNAFKTVIGSMTAVASVGGGYLLWQYYSERMSDAMLKLLKHFIDADERELSRGTIIVDKVVTKAITSALGVSAVIALGSAYIAWYKRNVLNKIVSAFSSKRDPAMLLTFTSHGKSWPPDVCRNEQDQINRIVNGIQTGHYWMLLGPKGTGKMTMIVEAMRACQKKGVAICEAHPNLEVFRLRLGRALKFEFNEDSQTGLFHRRDPRDGGPALDIERASNKLNRAALQYFKRTGRPLVLIINNTHYFKNDDEGRDMLLQLQHHAELGSDHGILTFIFSSDDFWPSFVMRESALSRIRFMSVYDLDFHRAVRTAMRMRQDEKGIIEPEETFKAAISLVGGRLSTLSKLVSAEDMLAEARHLLAVEKEWLLSQIGLIENLDDDIVKGQKRSLCSWLLLCEFVRMRQDEEERLKRQIAAGEKTAQDLEGLALPKLPYYQCCQIMARADFLEELDRSNIVAIDTYHNVSPDSKMLLVAAREVIEEEGFDTKLQNVKKRVNEIEALRRTQKIIIRDGSPGCSIHLEGRS
ncbi:hypothetical protein BXZ70DRAFT_1045607 [Cristinia sonorae]|uniref:AAA+ ATPase domain-containing protein n=1 Tax=Cristinia sonorae TaxID=1940300 RepID=A0A8K0XL23_9AGAR|nr:hypothetical protein BXZ70DRAFT_1045607 [Cristinia sonorae]